MKFFLDSIYKFNKLIFIMGTHYKGNKNEISALNTYLKLIRAAESLRSRVTSSLSKSGLTESQFGVLDALFHLGPLNQSELGNKIMKSGGNITMVVDNLEKQELVKRERGLNDRRLFKVHLTQKGTDLYKKISPDLINKIITEVSVLSEVEQAELQRMCKVIGSPIRLSNRK